MSNADRFKFRFWDNECDKMYPDNMNYGVSDECVFEFCSWGVEHRGNMIPMQSTGLRDKNGVLIFEGDIIRMHNWCGEDRHLDGVISWDTDGAWSCGFGHLYEIYGEMGRVEVIGNIHENPELMENNE